MQKFAQIPEREAPPDVAALYADIRRVTQVPLVNLVYRHMATLPGVLPWVWSLIRPQILAGTIEAAANRVVAVCELPSISPFGSAELRSAGLDPVAHETVMRILEAYNRGNSLNMVNLSAVRLALDVGAMPFRDQETSPAPDRPLPAIPPIVSPAELDADTAARLAEIAQLHSGAGVLPSLYLHLAHWPGFVALACDRLAPALRDGGVVRARDEVRLHAAAEARMITPLMSTTAPTPSEHVPALRDALNTFTQHLIPEMVPVGFALSRAMPRE